MKRNINGKYRSEKTMLSYNSKRKTCFTYGSTNHLDLNCRKTKRDLTPTTKP